VIRVDRKRARAFVKDTGSPPYTGKAVPVKNYEEYKKIIARIRRRTECVPTLSGTPEYKRD